MSPRPVSAANVSVRSAGDRTVLAEAVASGRMSTAEAAERAGRDPRTIRRWVAEHRAGAAG